MDIVVKGQVLLQDGLRRTAVGIEEGRIVEVADDLQGNRVIDAGEAWVLPGAIDAHVHLRDPGFPRKETFRTGTESAAFGGVTAVLDMPNTDPPTTTREALHAKRDRAGDRALVDFGLYAGVTSDPGSLDLLDEATAIKVYMGATTGHLTVEDPDLVTRALEASATHGKVVAFHAEDPTCMEAHRGELEGAAPDDWDAHLRSRPPSCEVEAIRDVLTRPRPDGSKPHIAHLSTAGGLELVRDAQAVTCEVAPHHLLLDRRDVTRGSFVKMNPPLRPVEDVEALWQGLIAGDVGMVASDHAPHTREEKDAGVHDAPSGVPGVETLLPLLLHEAVEGRLPLERVMDATARVPGARFGLPKGRIHPGYDGDLLVVDPGDVRTVRGSELHSRCGWTPYEGLEAIFPRTVLVRGRPVVEEGKLVGEPGWGRYLDGTWTPLS